MAGAYGVMGDDGSIDYTVHEAWNEATNVYLIVILVSFGLFMYAKRNKRKIMRTRKYDYQQPQNQADSVQLSLE
ncbi:PREDICTED: small integral membrane protein 19 [Galeopterus variegatus]|uniref:Small integral membrane protein 19 n=1 Tax=Galeopterus variegatus TaxID=482537 RepID=A0ABM0QM42_GALVR|nr:PREDICTED: small integral membrane protein 19 [Galeopterus variegatus]